MIHIAKLLSVSNHTLEKSEFLDSYLYRSLKQAEKQSNLKSNYYNDFQIANIHWIMEKAREFQKNIYFCFIDYAKAFDCVDHNKAEMCQVTKSLFCYLVQQILFSILSHELIWLGHSLCLHLYWWWVNRISESWPLKTSSGWKTE